MEEGEEFASASEDSSVPVSPLYSSAVTSSF